MITKSIKLDDVIVDIASGPFGSSLKVECFVPNGFPIIDGANLTEFSLTDNITKFVTEEKARSLARSIAKKHDIVVTISGTLGQISYIPLTSKYEEYLCSQRQFRATFDESKIDVEYLVYYFHTKQGQKKILSFANYVGVPALSQPIPNFRNIRIELPDIDYQHRVAKLIGLLNDKITLNTRINAELEAMAKQLYDYWFVQFDFPDENGKPYKSSGGKMVWNEKLKREIPEGWEVSTYGSIFDVKLGGTPSTSEKDYWECGTINWLNSGEVQNFPVNESEKKITEAAKNGSSTEFLPKGSVLISITRYLRVTILNIDACINQSVAGFAETELYKFPYTYFSLSAEVPRLMSLRTGAQQPHINKETVEESPILLPPVEVLETYYRKVKPIFKLLITNSEETSHFTHLRNSLLPMLMNGQVTIEENGK